MRRCGEGVARAAGVVAKRPTERVAQRCAQLIARRFCLGLRGSSLALTSNGAASVAGRLPRPDGVVWRPEPRDRLGEFNYGERGVINGSQRETLCTFASNGEFSTPVTP
jgi:hypothetical protein